MRKIPTPIIILMGLSVTFLGVAAWKTYSYKPFSLTEADLRPNEADKLCYSLLVDFSQDPAMKDKVRGAVADNLLTEDECQDLITYHRAITAAKDRQDMNDYLAEAQSNVK